VGAGLVPLAIGTETFGSIISPSVQCGTVGFRPTFGRVSRAGAMALAWSMDKVGPICRSVADAAQVFAVLHGADPRDPSSRSVGFTFQPRQDLRGVTLGIDSAAFDKATDAQSRALETLKALGATLVPLTLPDDEMIFTVAWRTIQVETATVFAELIEDSDAFQKLQPTDYRDWQSGMRCGALIPATEYLQSQRLRRRFMEQFERTLGDLDGYVTLPGHGLSLPLTNLCGHPEVVLQCGISTDNLPEMLSFVGRIDRDDNLLSIAHAFEQSCPPRWP
jgi:Asp-tRNA(Asn)/Glu-tRNA(Gln) amidotransferase A subunit family amidase